MIRLRQYVCDGTTYEVALALTRDEFRRCVNARTDAAVERELLRLETAGCLLSSPDRFDRWVRNRPPARGRRRLLVFAGMSDTVQLARESRRLRLDARDRGELGTTRVRFLGC